MRRSSTGSRVSFSDNLYVVIPIPDLSYDGETVSTLFYSKEEISTMKEEALREDADVSLESVSMKGQDMFSTASLADEILELALLARFRDIPLETPNATETTTVTVSTDSTRPQEMPTTSVESLRELSLTSVATTTTTATATTPRQRERRGQGIPRRTHSTPVPIRLRNRSNVAGGIPRRTHTVT